MRQARGWSIASGCYRRLSSKSCHVRWQKTNRRRLTRAITASLRRGGFQSEERTRRAKKTHPGNDHYPGALNTERTVQLRMQTVNRRTIKNGIVICSVRTGCRLLIPSQPFAIVFEVLVQPKKNAPTLWMAHQTSKLYPW